MLELSALAFAYMISLFYRAVIAVIAPELTADLGLSESELGTLSSLFFAGFAAAQIPVGAALDRFGPRLTVSVFMILAVAGTGLLAASGGFSGAAMGVTLIGIGCAPIFTGSMVVVARKHPPERFAFITSLIIALGGVGDMLSTTPMALLSEAVGWRGAMSAAAGLTVIAAFACAGLIEAEKRSAEHRPENLGSLLAGTIRVAAIRGLWPILPLSFLGYAALMAVRGLWSGPYLADVFALDTVSRGGVLMAMSVALGLGTFAYGLADRVLRRSKVIVAAGTLVKVLALFMLAALAPKEWAVAAFLLVVFGSFGFTYPVLMAHGRSFIPANMTGRGLSFLTLVNFLGVAVVQAASGSLMERLSASGTAPIDAYATLHGWLAAVLGASLLVYVFSKRSGIEPA